MYVFSCAAQSFLLKNSCCFRDTKILSVNMKKSLHWRQFWSIIANSACPEIGIPNRNAFFWLVILPLRGAAVFDHQQGWILLYHYILCCQVFTGTRYVYHFRADCMKKHWPALKFAPVFLCEYSNLYVQKTTLQPERQITSRFAPKIRQAVFPLKKHLSGQFSTAKITPVFLCKYDKYISSAQKS